MLMLTAAAGPSNLAAAVQAASRMMQLQASDAGTRSGAASRKANYIKQYQDRLHQMNLAGLEFEHLNQQIASTEIRIRIANMEIANQQQTIDNAPEVEEFLRNKYTNDELYAYPENN